jgi:hypothetical protein
VEYQTFVDLKEYWNATAGSCGWYMMGAEGLKSKILSGINHKINSYKEIFSRYSDHFSFSVPKEKSDRIAFYRKLITDVLSVNMTDKTQLNVIVNKCLQADSMDGESTGLRRAESLLILSQNA